MPVCPFCSCNQSQGLLTFVSSCLVLSLAVSVSGAKFSCHLRGTNPVSSLHCSSARYPGQSQVFHQVSCVHLRGGMSTDSLKGDSGGGEGVKRKANEAGLSEHLQSLGGFHMDRILSSYPSKKMIAVVGSLEGKEGQAVVILEKKAFDPDTISSDVAKCDNLERDFDNAEYAVYNAELPAKLNRVSCTVIHPATEKHIAKYCREDLHMLSESPETYKNVTAPYVEREELGKRIAWVHNIISGEKEKERVLFRDDDPDSGFILLPDMKWDQESVASLYCLAIVVRKDLRSLRSLSASHLPLLRNLLQRGSAELHQRFGIEPHNLRVYLHYQPTFYHLHVHFTHAQFDASGIEAGRAHLLSDVIDNLSLNGNYYQERTMHFMLRTTLGLYKEFVAAGHAPSSA